VGGVISGRRRARQGCSLCWNASASAAPVCRLSRLCRSFEGTRSGIVQSARLGRRPAFETLSEATALPVSPVPTPMPMPTRLSVPQPRARAYCTACTSRTSGWSGTPATAGWTPITPPPAVRRVKPPPTRSDVGAAGLRMLCHTCESCAPARLSSSDLTCFRVRSEQTGGAGRCWSQFVVQGRHSITSSFLHLRLMPLLGWSPAVRSASQLFPRFDRHVPEGWHIEPCSAH
jgi:hypothetical protein